MFAGVYEGWSHVAKRRGVSLSWFKRVGGVFSGEAHLGFPPVLGVDASMFFNLFLGLFEPLFVKYVLGALARATPLYYDDI